MRIRPSILGLALLLIPCAQATAQKAKAPDAKSPKAKAPDAVLTELGLEAEKTRYVFADAERELIQKYRDARDARDRARQAVGKIQAGAMMQEQIMELQAGAQQLQAEAAAIRSNGSRMGYGRYGRYYRNQANAVARREQQQATQVRNRIAQAKKQLPNEKQTQADQIGARAAVDLAKQTVKDVNEAYDALEERYQEAREKPGVLKALEDAGIGFRLGPSEEAEKAGKWAKGILKIRAKRPTLHSSRTDSLPPEAKSAGDSR